MKPLNKLIVLSLVLFTILSCSNNAKTKTAIAECPDSCSDKVMECQNIGAKHTTLPQVLLDGNQQWANDLLKESPNYFNELSQGQSPEYLYIGCSDSRVPVEQMFGLGAGDIFVHRNIANTVSCTDNSINAVIQYAVEHLKVKHIIICGHYDCGGVKAALSPNNLGQLNNWLHSIRDVYNKYYDKLSNIENKKEKINRLIEKNVIEQCHNVMKIDHVQKSWKESGYPHIHGVVFDIYSGKVIDLGVESSALYDSVKTSHNIDFQ